MKRVLILLTLAALLLCGCAPSGQLLKEPVTFYYILDEYEYGSDTGIIAPEEREAAGHRDDLSYLIALYLVGPSEEGLRSPIPWGTRVFKVEESPAGIYLKLSDTSNSMTDSAFTVACACLTLTCLDLTGAEQVTIDSGSRSVTMTRESIVLFDGIRKTEEST